MAVASISEYSAALNTPQMIKARMLKGGEPVMKNGRQVKYSGGFCVVFPYETPNKKYAVRCWHTNIDDIQQRTRLISNAIKTASLPYFVGFEYVACGLQTACGAQDIIVMDWVDAQPLKRYISNHISQASRLVALANNFKNMVADLHAHNLAHGDLQHGNILVRDNGSIVLVDYDSMYVPSLFGYADNIKGLAGYQHPSRWQNKIVNEKIDYFSELIIYTSLIALSQYPNLWEELNLEDTETLLFTADDISSNGNSQIFKLLSANQDLKWLVNKIIKFLHTDNIDKLEPLEKAIIDPKEQLLNTLSEEWGDNGYVYESQTPEDFRNVANECSKLW